MPMADESSRRPPSSGKDGHLNESHAGCGDCAQDEDRWNANKNPEAA